MTEKERIAYDKGYNAGYRAGLRHRDGKAVPKIVADCKPPEGRRPTPEQTYRYMMREYTQRGGYMFEGARPAFECGEYYDEAIEELLLRGWIVPHDDPAKGWVPVPGKAAT